jgi:hypothetical protein
MGGYVILLIKFTPSVNTVRGDSFLPGYLCSAGVVINIE